MIRISLRGRCTVGLMMMILAVMAAGCISPVRPIGSAIRIKEPPIGDGVRCRSVQLKEIGFDFDNFHRRSPVCLEQDGALYYFRYDLRGNRLMGLGPDVLVKELNDRSISWKHPVSKVFEHSDSVYLDKAYRIGHDEHTSLLFIQSTHGVSIVRQSDGAFLVQIGRFYGLDHNETFDVELCVLNGDLAIGLFVKMADGAQEQQWFVLSESLLLTPER